MKDITKLINDWREARGWRSSGGDDSNPKDIAIGISTEAAEILEHFRFMNGEKLDTYIREHKHEIGEELADTLYCIIALADELEIDLEEAVQKKLVKSAKKYPEKR